MTSQTTDQFGRIKSLRQPQGEIPQPVMQPPPIQQPEMEHSQADPSQAQSSDAMGLLGNALGQLGSTFSKPDEEPMQVPNLITQGILPKNQPLPIAQPKFSPQIGEAALL